MTTWQSDLVPGVGFEVKILTPTLAADFLTRLPERQRLLSPRSVDRYATDMNDKQFPFTGDPIRFNVAGELIDGQHRCHAVIESGESVPVLVITGLQDVIHFIDGGRTRRFPDDLRINGYANHVALAALVSRVWHFEHGNYGYQGVPYIQDALYANVQPSRSQLWQTLRAHPELVEVITNAHRVHRYLPNAPLSVTALVWYLLGSIDVDAREKFFYELTQGADQTGPEYPITVLRRTLTRAMNPGESREGHIWLAYYVKGYNAWAEGRTISYLRMPVPVRWNSLPLPVGMERPLVTAPGDDDGSSVA